ncbi:MAG: hypothetical protein ACRDPO_34415 [Streptosporangiaceae bacterium]
MVPWIYRDCGGALEVATLGCSLGAFHWRAWGERGAPHGWPSWRAQVAQHMPRFC